MNYQIGDGIPESDLSAWLAKATKKYGTFSDGRVDYTKADIAPIVMCTVAYDNKILIVKRGYGLADANGYWSTVNGFIDADIPVREQARQELFEELGLTVNSADIKVGLSYTLNNPKEKRSYIIFPCLIKLPASPKIILDSENTDCAWIKRPNLEQSHILDDLPIAVDAALALA